VKANHQRVRFDRWAPVVLGTAMALAGCQDSGSTSGPDVTTDPAPTGQLVAGPAHDVGAGDDGAVAFRKEGAELVAESAAHGVRVTDGIAVVTAKVSGQATTPLALETTEISRGELQSIPAARGQAIGAAGEVAIDRGVAIEELKNRVDGVEQSWRFAAAPEGAGDLVVGIAASGAPYLSETAHGLHFGKAGQIGYRYGNATWQSADGGEWEISPKWQDGRIVISIPEDVLAKTTFPAVLDPTVSAEVAVDNPVVGFTGVGSRNTSVAFDGTNYLVVWSDDRDDSKNPDIWGTRVSQAGAVLDATNLKINAGPGKQDHPAVVWTGSTFVVAWEDFKVAGGTEADIAAATVSSAGAVTQLGAVASTAASETLPKLASTGGNNALLVWQSGAAASGDVLGSVFAGSFGAPFAIANTAAAEFGPAVGASGTNYLVAWALNAASSDLQGTFVSTAGAPGTAFTISAGAGGQSNPTIGFDGTNFDVAFTNNSGGINLYGSRVTTAGAVLDTHVEGMATIGGKVLDAAAGNQDLSNIACTAAGCLLVFQDNRNQATTNIDVYGLPIATDFTVGTEFPISAANLAQQVPTVVAAAGGYFATWSDTRDDNASTATAARISGAGAVTDANGIVLARGTNRETTPRLGSTSAATLVAWTDSRAYGTDIEGARFNPNGSKLDANAVAISNATFSQITPAVTALGTSFYVVWSDSRGGLNRDIYASRINASGGSLDPAGIAISTATGDQLTPDVAQGPSGTALVVWADRRGTTGFDIYGALVNSSGVPTVSDIVISAAANDQNSPTVAYDSTNNVFVVIWSDQRNSTSNADVYGTRISAAGAVLDGAGVVISNAAGSQLTPDLSFGNGEFYAAWEDRRADSQGDIYGARLTAAGSLAVVDASGVAISTGAQQQFNPVTSSITGGFFVGWVDTRNTATSGTDIWGAQIATNGTKTGAEFVVSANPENEGQPDANNVNGVAMVAYTRAAPATDTVRVETRRITFSTGNGQSCTANNQCSTGFCVDNRCCDTACGGNVNTDCQACAASKTGKPDGTCSPIGAGTICRNYANTFCDLREYCDGVATDCPADIGRNQGLVCNSVSGSVCPANAAPGPHGCP
jgi:hypothetical protein